MPASSYRRWSRSPTVGPGRAAYCHRQRSCGCGTRGMSLGRSRACRDSQQLMESQDETDSDCQDPSRHRGDQRLRRVLELAPHGQDRGHRRWRRRRRCRWSGGGRAGRRRRGWCRRRVRWARNRRQGRDDDVDVYVTSPRSSTASAYDPSLVRSAQQALNDKGYNAGTADGQWGPATQDATRRFQQASGLPATGELDRSTLTALGV